ncbi:DNA polymerase III subunit alpha [Buchnera aphidicola]|uniref:DNA polymerase III subunit alpha n=1 Tax=Buchnera aphidicola TaxID=9 RepID=UPI0034646301
MIESKFVHLHVHTDYSMVDGLSKPEDLIKKAFSLNMSSLAITDCNNLFGAIKFYNAAHKLGIKPIIGATVQFISEFIKLELTEMTILAVNQQGYNNLIILISRAYEKGYFDQYNVTIKKKWLLEHHQGLILLSGGCQGEIGKILLKGDCSLLSNCLLFYKKYFANYFYLELMRTGRTDEEKYLNLAVDLSLVHDIPVVATNAVCFLNKKDFSIHQIRVAINKGQILNHSNINSNYSDQQFLKTAEEMCDLFSDIPEALMNSVEISKRCNVFIESGKYFLPQFPTGKQSTEKYLIAQAITGLQERLKKNYTDKKEYHRMYNIYRNRLDVELNIINKMGFPGYFLIVMEFIQWAKDNNIPVGPGRGSGASSLVAYALKITEVDPFLFDLLFERFLNPERVSMPDLDIDFCMDKRDKVIEHVSEIYGRKSVAQIITFGTMTAKAVIRDVGRVLGYPYGFINKLSKLIPLDPGMTLKEAFSKNSELFHLYNSNEDVKRLIDISKKLEGTNRNVGKHAGGVVISPTKISDFCPLYCDEKGENPVTQFDKNDIEYVGLVKFDFLGLRTLTVIHDAVKMINIKLKLKNCSLLDINAISLNDSVCFELLKKSETNAVFQLESYGMKDLINRLQPDCFEDIVALVALFRPGPLQSGMVDNFINRKHGREEISYPDKKWQHILLKPILESTYGIILYQEQVMQIAQVLAGYTLGSADILRRAMSKKNFKDMQKQRFIFEKGAQKNNIRKELAVKIFDLLEKFAGYGFNKSHSVAYALVSYQTLWLKYYYPSEFMAAAMNSEIDNTDKIVNLVNESLNMGLKIIPPNINLSRYKFYIHSKNNIIYGMGAIKGVGKSSIQNIVQERQKNGNFSDLFDLCMRTDPRKITHRVLEKLVMSGSFDCFHMNRQYLITQIDNIIKSAKEYVKVKKCKQKNLFGILKNELNPLEKDASLMNSLINMSKVSLDQEYQVLGLYLTGHPINQYLYELKHYVNGIRLSELKFFKKPTIISVSGIIISIKIKITKHQNRIVLLTIDDNTSHLEVVVFSKLFIICESFLKLNEVIIVEGNVSINSVNKKVTMIANTIISMNMARKKYVHRLIIFLDVSTTDHLLLNKLYQFLKNEKKGSIPVFISYSKKNIVLHAKLNRKWSVSITDNLLIQLHTIIGLKKIKLDFHKTSI